MDAMTATYVATLLGIFVVSLLVVHVYTVRGGSGGSGGSSGSTTPTTIDVDCSDIATAGFIDFQANFASTRYVSIRLFNIADLSTVHAVSFELVSADSSLYDLSGATLTAKAGYNDDQINFQSLSNYFEIDAGDAPLLVSSDNVAFVTLPSAVTRLHGFVNP